MSKSESGKPGFRLRYTSFTHVTTANTGNEGRSRKSELSGVPAKWGMPAAALAFALALLGTPQVGWATDISVMSATYGGNCNVTANNISPIISNACDGKTYCEYDVDPLKLGDPAPGCKKDFEVRYTCVGSAEPRTISLPAETIHKASLDCSDVLSGAAAAAAAVTEQSPTVPVADGTITMKECDDGLCGLWTVQGTKGEGRWTDGEIADLTIEQHANGEVIVRSSVVSGPQKGMTATYTGTRTDNSITKGVVTYRVADGNRASSTWSADIDLVTAADALTRARAAMARQDQFEALRWFMAGAARGDARLELDAGVAFYQGAGLPKDFRKAVDFFGQSAQQGNIDAALNMAHMYENGLGVPRDSALQAEWLKKAGPAAVEAARQQLARTNAGNHGSIFTAIGDAMAARQQFCQKDQALCDAQEQRDQAYEQQQRENDYEERLREQEMNLRPSYIGH